MLSQNPTPSQVENKEEKSELEELKKKRDEYTIEIRKQKREEILSKKRNRNQELEDKIKEGILESYNLVEDPQLKECVAQWIKRSFKNDEFFPVMQAANSSDLFQQHYGVIGLRKILSTGNPIMIQTVIDSNLIPKLISYMKNPDQPHLQMEAAWALTNVASGTTQQTQSIIDKGGIECFIELLETGRDQLVEQAIWALANIAGDSTDFRDKILRCGGLEGIIKVLGHTTDRNHIKYGTWAISNLCRGKPLPPLKDVEIAIPIICAVMKRENDYEVLTDASWALAYLSREEEKINDVILTGVVPRIVHFLDEPVLQLQVPCLRTIGNIVTGTRDQAGVVLQEPEFLPKIFWAMNHKKKPVRKEACWTLSNLTIFCAEFSEPIIGNAQYLKTLMDIALSDTTEVQREALWVISNATKNSNADQISRMVDNGVLECFVHLLKNKDDKIVEIVLEGLWNILNWGAMIAGKTGSSENPFLVELDNKEGVSILEDLQNHPNHEVYARALKILEHHFELENLLGI